ncbi:glycoside hydrolase family 97 protein [Marinilabiliaceae bacterium JC017]|nr:glycoside hydrolase family 97 protein [Marinilabiliaceae bacterium JC017]
MKKFLMFGFLLAFSLGKIQSKEYKMFSPDKKLTVAVNVGESVWFSLNNGEEKLILPSAIALELEKGLVLGENCKVIKKATKTVNNTLKPVITQKSASVIENYNELKLVFDKDFSLLFRAYNEGVAYRFETAIEGDIVVKSEKGDYRFAENFLTYWPKEYRFHSNNQVYYHFQSLAELGDEDLGSLPLLIDCLEGTKLVIGETGLVDYPGMWFNGAQGNNLSITNPGYPKKTEQVNDRDVFVREREEYIAKTSGTRAFPWRYIAVADKDEELISNQLSWLLANPCQIEDPSWIKPGKVAWDWWNANMVYNVDFRSGVNTETYKYYIDFAAEYGIEYIIMDEGWYVLGDLMNVVPEIDMEELSSYAEEKGVGIILWVVWKTLDDQLDEALDQFAKWGIKGIKVDFMDKDDQWMVNYYHRIAEAAAKRKILVNFHGAYKPAGIRRMYPNVLTREGVNGGEQYKWSMRQTPEHNLITPFSRMVAGPMDYTPGAMTNAQEKDYKPIFDQPMSMGTRCHQVAMFVVYESPLQMLCDSPTRYYKERECTEFLSHIPTVWDETVPLKAKVSDYLAVARRNGDEWYVGAMTDWTGREITIDLSFLEKGKYKMIILKDGINADRCAMDYKKEVIEVTAGEQVTIKMAPGGGWAARIVAVNK